MTGRETGRPAVPGRDWARQLSEDEAARIAAEGGHCESRRCRQPVAVVTGHWFTRAGRRALAEHFVCLGHGQEFARRHNLEMT